MLTARSRKKKWKKLAAKCASRADSKAPPAVRRRVVVSAAGRRARKVTARVRHLRLPPGVIAPRARRATKLPTNFANCDTGKITQRCGLRAASLFFWEP